MGIVERTGGRKWWGLLATGALLAFVLVWLTVTGRLDGVSLATLVAGILGLKGSFDAANTGITKKSMEVRNAEATRLSGMSDTDVLTAARATEAARVAVDGATVTMRGTVDAARAEVSRTANAGRERLRRAAEDGGGGGGGGRC